MFTIWFGLVTFGATHILQGVLADRRAIVHLSNLPVKQKNTLVKVITLASNTHRNNWMDSMISLRTVGKDNQGIKNTHVNICEMLSSERQCSSYSPRARSLLFMFLRSKGLNILTYVEFCVDFRTELLTNQLLCVRSEIHVMWTKVRSKMIIQV